MAVTPDEKPTRRGLLIRSAGVAAAMAAAGSVGAVLGSADPAEAHALLEDLPLGRAEMMTFELIPMGPLWPLGLLLSEPAK